MAENNNDNEQLPPNGGSTTPLLFLLDGVLSRDEVRVATAVNEIAQLIHPHQLFPDGANTTAAHESPCTSQAALCYILTCLLTHHPEFASMRSEHDGSLPLHFAASLGNVQVASIILSKVNDGVNRGFVDVYRCLSIFG
jgi:hypothetical protein